MSRMNFKPQGICAQADDKASALPTSPSPIPPQRPHTKHPSPPLPLPCNGVPPHSTQPHSTPATKARPPLPDLPAKWGATPFCHLGRMGHQKMAFSALARCIRARRNCAGHGRRRAKEGLWGGLPSRNGGRDADVRRLSIWWNRRRRRGGGGRQGDGKGPGRAGAWRDRSRRCGSSPGRGPARCPPARG